jgi:hypothetical protein
MTTSLPANGLAPPVAGPHEKDPRQAQSSHLQGVARINSLTVKQIINRADMEFREAWNSLPWIVTIAMPPRTPLRV